MTAGAALSQPATNNNSRISKCESHSFDRRKGRPTAPICPQAAPGSLPGAQVTSGQAAPDERLTAAIVYRDADQNTFICTGVLLDELHILTAGHCGCGNSYEVTFSEFARNGNRTNAPLEIDGPPILFDPSTCVRGPKPGNDLALIRLKKRFILKDGTDLLPLGYPLALVRAVRDQMKPGDGLKVVGFGETNTGRIGVRMRAFVPVLTRDCFETPYRLSCAPFLEMILAERGGAQVPRDTCGGDSGGPVFIHEQVTLPPCTADFDPEHPDPPITKPQDVVVAITSRAAPFAQPLRGDHCGGGGIYTLIGRRSVHAWFDANGVKRQECVTQ
jgi:hypothetical protein